MGEQRAAHGGYMPVRFEWHGDRLEREVERLMRGALARISERLVGEAKVRAPVDTGNLRNSIDWGWADNVTTVVGTPVEYGVYQEVGFLSRGGTFVQNAYLLPALMENATELGNIVRDVAEG